MLFREKNQLDNTNPTDIGHKVEIKDFYYLQYSILINAYLTPIIS